MQETLEAGCKNVDDVVKSLKHVKVQDRSMVWNTDLCEVSCLSSFIVLSSGQASVQRVGRSCLLHESCSVPWGGVWVVRGQTLGSTDSDACLQ